MPCEAQAARDTLAYYTLAQPDGDLYVSRLNGTQRRPLTFHTAIDGLARWSPDGEWLAMFSNRGGPLQLCRARLDDSGLQRITTQRSAFIAGAG